ncbi:hypothetical protein F183_A43880 [Bryobacterales bacterium F-183]|nr:hypothetical protein F183_A43880 [Bryobacterales bacterium F-183]
MSNLRVASLLLVAASCVALAQGRRGNPPPQEIHKIAADFEGVLKKVNGSKILLEVADGNVMEITTTRKTAVVIKGKHAQVKQLVEDQPIQVEARRGPGAVEAVTIRQGLADQEKTTNRPLKP